MTRQSPDPSAPPDLASAVYGLEFDPFTNELPEVTADALVDWLAGDATDRRALRRVVRAADWGQLLGIVEVAWQRRVFAARARVWRRDKQALLRDLKALEPRVAAIGGRSRDHFHALCEAVQTATPVLLGVVWDDEQAADVIESDRQALARLPHPGRPGSDRDLVDGALRDAGIGKSDRRLILRLLAAK